jgi:3-hydroxyisobutyrate dehydrogenase
MQTVAVLGLGKMGYGIAFRFVQRGYKVFVWNRSPEKSVGLINAGAVWLENPADAGFHTSFVVSMVADDIASKAVWLGSQGALKNMSKGSFVIECSTLSMKHVEELAIKAAKHDLIYIDCPVTGLPYAALHGNLTLLVGADSKHLKLVTPLLKEISSTIRHFGKVGSGTGYKLRINLMGAIQIAALAEGIVLAERLGLDMETVIDAIENSAAASPQVIRYVRPMAEKKFSEYPAFTIGLRTKDARYGVSLAESLNSPILLGKVAFSVFSNANKMDGEKDEASVVG